MRGDVSGAGGEVRAESQPAGPGSSPVRPGHAPVGPDRRLAEAAAARTAALTEAARTARDDAAAAGTLVWDPFDPNWVRDPYPIYEELRAASPVHRSPLGFWVFTRHADCLQVLRDRRASSDPRTAELGELADVDVSTLAGADSPDGATQMLDEMAPFIFRDPPDHTRLRGLVQKAFTPKVVDSLRPRAQQVCDDLLDAALQRGQADLVRDYAYPLPVTIIAEMLGVPTADHERFKEWSDALARGLDPDFLLPPQAVEQRLTGILSFVGYFAALIEERRRHPGEDLLTRLIQAEEQGDALTPGELISTCILLLVAGHETTVNLISGGALALMEHPDELQRFRDDPAVVRNGVEEILRYVSPVQLTGRSAMEDMEIAGVTMAAGEFCFLLLGSANRDPAVFPDPDDFDVTRSEVNHLGFGFGIHHCLGAPLARLEAQVALPALLRRVRRLERVDDVLDYKENVVLRGLASLPVTLAAS